MAIFSRLFSVCPRVNKVKGTLVASTAWRVRILTLGWLYRQVTLDPKKHELTIYRRYLWVFARRRRIRFEKIEAVTYAYQDWSPPAFLILPPFRSRVGFFWVFAMRLAI